MKILLINLAQASDRLAFQTAQFERMGLSFERVEAVRGDDVDPAYYKKMAASGLRLMSKNEVGCFLSHLTCWKKCVALNEPVLILEDDAVVGDDLVTILNAQHPINAPFIMSLEIYSSKKRLGTKIYDFNNNQSLYELIYAGAGSGGYMITPNAATLCIEKANHQIGLADLFLNTVKGVKYSQLVPACVMQLCFFEPSPIIQAAMQTSINSDNSRRPSSIESFLANPMTRVRRIKSWFVSRYQRFIKLTPNAHIAVTPSEHLYHSLEQTKKYLHG
jgi:glycosyl transferase, family 25